jgi:ADP-dependent phosphofructokinase/glucokinase
MEIKFTKLIDANKREDFALQIVSKLETDLIGLQVDSSYESGFNLPLTKYWLEKDYGEYLNKIIKYHDSRQLRFCFSNDSKYVTGLRFKDGIKYWSDQEINKLINAIEEN